MIRRECGWYITTCRKESVGGRKGVWVVGRECGWWEGSVGGGKESVGGRKGWEGEWVIGRECGW